jgi:prolyl-tRNA synthetase
MAKKEEEKDIGITVKKKDDMSEWYNQVVLKAELAEFSDVKGCIVIRPNGYAIWESIQKFFDPIIKQHNVRNCYFPVFIPEHYFKKEAEHAKGFSPEVAWVTHAGDEKLDEKLAIRPTSETIIAVSFAKWLRSHRDLPIKVNQWCNVVRWETKATRPFLRSREFLWQEGHCIYETEEENVKEVLEMLHEYKKICEELLAIPVILGVKTQKEKFAGAKDTYTVEALMPDGRALQMGTSHNLGQGFMKAFNVKFLGKDEKYHTPYYSSWGISTRMIGGIIMTHGDDKGLVIPPRASQNKIVIVPIILGKNVEEILKKAKELKKELKEYAPILDDRSEYTPGWKFNEWEMKGIPLRLEIGPRDIDKAQVVLVRRDTNEKLTISFKDLKKTIDHIIDKMQTDLFIKAKKFLDENIVETTDWKEFMQAIKDKKMVKTIFCNEAECEDWIKDKTNGAVSRCIPLGSKKPKGNCVHCGKEAQVEIYFSKSY